MKTHNAKSMILDPQAPSSVMPHKMTGPGAEINPMSYMLHIRLNEFMASISGKRVTRPSANLRRRNQQLLDRIKIGRKMDIGITDASLVNIDVHNLPSIKPPRWKEAHKSIKAVYWQKALTEKGPVVKFDMNLSLTLIDHARHDPDGFMDLIRRAMKRNLDRVLERDVDFWFALETANDGLRQGRPHLHGAIGATKNEHKLVQEALHAVNGEVDPYFEKYAIHLKKITNGAGVALYATKSRGLTRLFFPKGTLLTRTNPINRLAKELYEHDKREIESIESPVVH